MFAKSTILWLLIGGFILIHLIWTATDPRPLKDRIRSYYTPVLFQTYAVTIALLLINIASGLLFPWPSTSLDTTFELIGIAIYFVGLTLAMWAKFEMKTSWGSPGQHDIKRQTRLVTTGPFAFTRNPIYLGLILAVFGFALSLRSYAITLTYLFVLYFRRKIMKEEILLQKHFGQTYTAYKKRAQRFL